MTPSLFAATICFTALGAVARAITMDKLRPHLPMNFPWTTLVVNFIACLLIGVVLTHDIAPQLQTMLATGFLGGYSTMSTLNHDAVMLFESHRYLHCFAYVASSYVICLIACAIGFALP